METRELMNEVVAVMADVLVHQRARWGALLAHQRQYEGWWKAEMALALESWTWRADRQTKPMYVLPEAKPRDFEIDDGPSSADLLVAPVNKSLNDFDYKARPRVWIELKERGTWWGVKPGGAAKAFGTANHGLWSDIEKWQNVKGRVRSCLRARSRPTLANTMSGFPRLGGRNSTLLPTGSTM
jgi:hypothetical protein